MNTGSRPYHSQRREDQARHTRLAILRAARELFAERGFVGTQLADVAARSGVSVPTIYASVGPKPQLAVALIGFINDEVDMVELGRQQQLAADGPTLLRANAHLTRVLNERCGDIMRALISGAAAEPDLVPALETGRRTHRQGQASVAKRLNAMGALRPGLSARSAGAILTAMTLPEVIHELTAEQGWSFERLERWLAQATADVLLGHV